MTSLLDPAVALPAAAVIGLCVGSFLNVVIHRLPKMRGRGWGDQCAELAGNAPAEAPRYNLVVPRSSCPACGHRITAAENSPVLSAGAREVGSATVGLEEEPAAAKVARPEARGETAATAVTIRLQV